MKISRYLISIVVFLVVAIFSAILFIAFNEYMPSVKAQDLAYFIPFTGASELIILFIVIFPLMALIGSILGTFLAPVLTLLHKKILGRNMDYGFEE